MTQGSCHRCEMLAGSGVAGRALDTPSGGGHVAGGAGIIDTHHSSRSEL